MSGKGLSAEDEKPTAHLGSRTGFSEESLVLGGSEQRKQAVLLLESQDTTSSQERKQQKLLGSLNEH